MNFASKLYPALSDKQACSSKRGTIREYDHGIWTGRSTLPLSRCKCSLQHYILLLVYRYISYIRSIEPFPINTLVCPKWETPPEYECVRYAGRSAYTIKPNLTELDIIVSYLLHDDEVRIWRLSGTILIIHPLLYYTEPLYFTQIKCSQVPKIYMQS